VEASFPAEGMPTMSPRQGKQDCAYAAPSPSQGGGVRVYRGAALPLTLTLSPVGEREIGRARFAPSSNEG
jgi:hypothetical protein